MNENYDKCGVVDTLKLEFAGQELSLDDFLLPQG